MSRFAAEIGAAYKERDELRARVTFLEKALEQVAAQKLELLSELSEVVGWAEEEKSPLRTQEVERMKVLILRSTAQEEGAV